MALMLARVELEGVRGDGELRRRMRGEERVLLLRKNSDFGNKKNNHLFP